MNFSSPPGNTRIAPLLTGAKEGNHSLTQPEAMAEKESLTSVLDEVKAWYSEMETALDNAGVSGSLHFAWEKMDIERADDTATAIIKALRNTRRYCDAPRDKDLREDCKRFISRIRAAR